MNYYILALTCLLNNPLLGMQKVTYSETLVPGGKSALTAYLHLLPRDILFAHIQLSFPQLLMSFQGIPTR